MTTESDRELLELAAKAAGMVLGAWREQRLAFMYRDAAPGPGYWNPLRNDGDALRLAVKMNLTVGEHLGARHAGRPPCPDDYEDGGYPVRIAQMDNDDPYAATRRAIVRAAAEIGRSSAPKEQA